MCYLTWMQVNADHERIRWPEEMQPEDVLRAERSLEWCWL